MRLYTGQRKRGVTARSWQERRNTRKRVNMRWNSPRKGLNWNDQSSAAGPSGIRTRGETLECFVPHDLHALHATPANVFLLEAVLNPPAQFTRGIVLAARDGAKLQPQVSSGRSE